MEPALQRIVERILTDAKEHAKSTVLDAHRSAEAILEKQREIGRQKASEEISSILSKARDDADTVRGMMLSDARRKASWTILSEKERLIERVLDEAKLRLATLAKTEKHHSILEKAIIDAGIALGGGELQVILNERDSALRLKLNAMSKKILEKTKNETSLELSSEKIKASGGAVVKTADGKVILDNTLEAMLSRRKKELRLKVAKILFK